MNTLQYSAHLTPSQRTRSILSRLTYSILLGLALVRLIIGIVSAQLLPDSYYAASPATDAVVFENTSAPTSFKGNIGYGLYKFARRSNDNMVHHEATSGTR